jgi:hypothetical protein
MPKKSLTPSTQMSHPPSYLLRPLLQERAATGKTAVAMRAHPLTSERQKAASSKEKAAAGSCGRAEARCYGSRFARPPQFTGAPAPSCPSLRHKHQRWCHVPYLRFFDNTTK